MDQDGHEVPVDLVGAVTLGFVGQQDDLDAQEGNEDQRASHGLHVEAGLGLVGHLKLGDQHPHNVQEEEEVHLKGKEREDVWVKTNIQLRVWILLAIMAITQSVTIGFIHCTEFR